MSRGLKTFASNCISKAKFGLLKGEGMAQHPPPKYAPDGIINSQLSILFSKWHLLTFGLLIGKHVYNFKTALTFKFCKHFH